MGKLSVVVMAVVFAAGSAMATGIGPPENGDLSAGNTTNWWIQQDGTGSNTYDYEDVGAPHAGVMRRQTADAGSWENITYNQSLADVGQDGSIDYQIVTTGTSDGNTIEFSFLGDPVQNSNGVCVSNNNRADRGYVVTFSSAWGTTNYALGRKDGSWSYSSLDTGSMSQATFEDGQWHTLAIHDDGAGNLSVDLDSSEILSATDANYLPTAYAANYAGGAHWGVNSGYPTNFRIDNLVVGAPPVGLIPEPGALALTLLGLPLLRRRKRS